MLWTTVLNHLLAEAQWSPIDFNTLDALSILGIAAHQYSPSASGPNITPKYSMAVLILTVDQEAPIEPRRLMSSSCVNLPKGTNCVLR